MSKRYRELLPLPNGDTESSSAATTSSSSADPGQDHVKKKRVGTPLACNECRRRKARCDGKRPACTGCVKRSAPCAYADKESQGDPATVAASMQVLDMLKSASEGQALDILRLLRVNGDPEAVMSMINARNNSVDATISPSPSLNPFADFNFEIMSRNPVAYPAWQPPDSAALESSSLLHPFPLRRTRSFDQRTLFTNQTRHFDPQLKSPDILSSSSSSREPSAGMVPGSRVHGPSTPPSPTLCDPRLESLNVTFWSPVDISSELAGRMISLYLETDHPLLGIFDPELFVSDLVQKGNRFCNRLLFAAVMYWGCSMYSAVDSTVSQYSPLFEKEAETLWSEEKSNDSFLNMAASQLLSLAYLGHGKDHFVLKYVASMNRMGMRLGLFGIPASAAAQKLQWVTEELTSPASYAAWGAFNWIIIWFHAAILDIFRPFIRRQGRKQSRLKTFSSSQSSPDAAYKASVDQLKRLIIIYRSKYTCSAYTMLWHTALIYVANAVLQDKQDPEWRFYFLLCIYGYESLRRSYRLAEAIGRGLLSMTLRNGDISSREARQILQQLQERGLSGASGDIRATFMVDLDLAMTDPDEARVESLAHRFEEMALFQEFTNADSSMRDEDPEASMSAVE